MKDESGYSSSVEMYLKVGNTRHEIAQITNGSLILRNDPEFNLSGYADLVVIVDDETFEHPVILTCTEPGMRELEYAY